MDNNQENNQELDKGTETKTYTQEEVDKLIQQAGDKRVQQALSKKEKEFAEAKKLLQMSDDEKTAYLKSQYETDLQAREKELALRENKLSAIEVLSSKGIPTSFVDLVLADTAEEMNKRISVLDTEFKKAVSEAVKAKLSSSTPRVATVQSEGLTKEQFKAMSVAQKNDLYIKNPELFRELSK